MALLLGRLGALLQRAVETEEPRLDLPAAFAEHWKGVTHYYLEASDENKPAKQTDIPWHLKQMLDILVYEEKHQPAGETGPCLEYLLQQKILETLSILGKAEYPPGMRSQVFLFFSRLLGQMQCPLLHYLSVYRPVQKLLQLQGDALAPEPEREALQLAAVLCAKIRKDPALLPYVLEGKRVGQKFPLQGAAAEPSGTPGQPPPLLFPEQPGGGGLCLEKPPGGASPAEPAASLPNLVTSLISLCKSKNRKVGLKAQENLLLLTSMDHPAVAQALAQDSALSLLVSDHLCTLYKALRVTLSPADVAALPSIQWRVPSDAPEEEEEEAFPGRRSLGVFFGWMDFCNSLVKEAHPVLGQALSEAVGQRLFVGTLQPQLLQMSESGLLFSTAILTGLVGRLRAPALLRQLVEFLLGAEGEPARPKDFNWHPQAPTLCSHLIDNCRHPSDEVSVATLQLFEELLQLPEPRILQRLVLDYLEERSYLLRCPPGQEEPAAHDQEPCEDELDLEEDPYFANGFPVALQNSSRAAVCTPEQPEGQVDVKEVVSSFLCLVPNEAKTSPYLEEAGYDTYVHDAKVLFQECCANVAHWSWPPAQPFRPGLPTGATFYEGRFLQVLLDRLAQILHQPYAVNLQVTSVLSRLALFPHPHLHEYLLDPYLPLAPGCRTLFSVMIRVIGGLMQRAHRIEDFPGRLLLVRRKLMGLVSEEEPASHQALLEGVIVLEEFCKELAAIVFVKALLKGPA